MKSNNKPGYIDMFLKGELEKRVKKAKAILTRCNLCPHECGVNRRESTGFCRASDKLIVSSYGPHYGEEDFLVGSNGSGTVFFGFCNMRCVFCQNCELSFGGEGKIVTNKTLSNIIIEIQNKYKCHNLNLVTPTHFVPNILEALFMAIKNGFQLPVVYNCGGYEKLDTLNLLDGIIDIYMPDFKYNISEKGEKYSGIKEYSSSVKKALMEMDRQVGGLELNEEGIAYRGLIIRHLMLPGGLEDTKEILKFIKEKLSSNCIVNLMDQYHPAHKAYKYKELTRRLPFKEYEEAVSFAQKLDINLVED